MAIEAVTGVSTSGTNGMTTTEEALIVVPAVMTDANTSTTSVVRAEAAQEIDANTTRSSVFATLTPARARMRPHPRLHSQHI